MKLRLIGVPSGLGQKKIGLELAPDFLRDKGIIEILSKKFEVEDGGNIYPLGNSWQLINRLYDESLKNFRMNRFQLLIGGDHSISMGSIQASLKVDPNVLVIWIDAHGDINTPETSLSGNLHGMPLAGLLGLFPIPGFSSLNLNPENLLMIGVRDLDFAEKEVIEKLKIKVVSADEVKSDPMFNLKKIASFINNGSKSAIHLSFDIDSLDPLLAPATGTKVPNGLSLEFVLDLVSIISSSGRLVSLEIVEFNPRMAVNEEELSRSVESIISVITTLSNSFK